MGFTPLLDGPFYTGVFVTSLVPGSYPVALNGRPYLVELDHNAIGAWGVYFKRESLPLMRDQADQGELPGEHSISPTQYWRRSQESWHMGAGQTYFDRKNSSPFRFRTSKGVNPWVQNQLTLLNDTSLVLSDAALTGRKLAVAGSRLYVTTTGGLSYSTDAAAFTAVTGMPATQCTSLATDGYNVWLACGTNGVYSTSTGLGAASSYATGTASLIGYVKGRLMAANANSIYNITASGAMPAALFTHGNSNFQWVGFAEGNTVLYAAGYSGTHSEIYRVTVNDTATALAAPTIAATLPDGETITSIHGYLGNVIIGSDKGVRFCTPDSTGNLTVGPLIPTTNPVKTITAWDRFFWFGWTNYDGTSTGLGRLDPSFFTSALTPAYASDVMATAQGTVVSARYFNGRMVFAVDGKGVYAETLGTPVGSGTVTSGFIGYDISDDKIASLFDLRFEPLPSGAALAAGLETNNSGTFAPLGTTNTTGATSSGALTCNQARAERFELQVTLTASGSTPTLTRWLLRARPAPAAASEFFVPLIIADTLDVGGQDRMQDVRTDYTALVDLWAQQTVFTYQEGNASYTVVMDDFLWLPDRQSVRSAGDWQGVFVAKLREIAG